MQDLSSLPALSSPSLRPDLRDKEITTRLNEEIVRMLSPWKGEAEPIEVARKIIERLPAPALTLAVFLEDNFGYEASPEMVRVLDQVWPKWLVLHQSAVQRWVVASLQRSLPLHTVIRFEMPDGSKERGQIIAILPETAQYQVKAGDETRLVNYEDALCA